MESMLLSSKPLVIDADEGDLQVSKGCNEMMIMMSIGDANMNYDDHDRCFFANMNYDDQDEIRQGIMMIMARYRHH